MIQEIYFKSKCFQKHYTVFYKAPCPHVNFFWQKSDVKALGSAVMKRRYSEG